MINLLSKNLPIAFESGWTKVDTSDNYGTEEIVARLIKGYAIENPEWKISSLITKFGRGGFEASRVDTLFGDLPIEEIHVLQHWPTQDYVQKYQKAQQDIDRLNSKYGRDKYKLGVSNFGRVHLEALEGRAPIEDIDSVEPEDIGNIMNQISQHSEDLIDPEPENIGNVMNQIAPPGSLRAQASPQVTRGEQTLSERISERRSLRRIDVPNLKDHEVMRLISQNSGVYARDIQSLQQVEEP